MNDPRRPAAPPESGAEVTASPPDAGSGSTDDATRVGSTPAVQADTFLHVIGGYVVVKKIGEGGMGSVYLTEDPKLGRKVAVKTMKPALAADKANRDRFEREARAAAAVEHENIVPIWGIGEAADGSAYIAMPFLQGEMLDARLKRQPVAGLNVLLKVAREVADGLAAAHAKGLIHRDIKPGNVWLEGDLTSKELAQQIRRCKILDFGLARSVDTDDAQLTASGAIMGTPAYMAPEQARGEKVDHRADLWSLGVMLYRMATGRLPFQGPNTMAVLFALASETPPPVRTLNPNLPPALADLIDRLMQKNPAARPQSAAEVSATVRQIVRDLQAKTSTSGVAVPAVPAAPAPGAWEEVTEAETAPPPKAPRPAPVKAESRSPRAPKRKPPAKRNRTAWYVAGAAAVLAVIAVAVMILRVETPEGTLVVEINDPDVEVRVKNGKLVLVGPDGKERYSIAPSDRNKTIAAGEYKVRVEGADGLVLDTPEFTLKKGGVVTVRVTLDPKTIAKRPNPVPPAALPATFKNGVGMEFVKVPKGTGWLGGGGGKEGETKVVIEQDFYLGKYEVTQGEWEAVMGTNPSAFSRAGDHQDAVKDIADAELKRFPVEMVSWHDCQKFIKKLNEREKESGWVYRLPKEAEWEYACRGGPVDKLDSAFDYYFAKPTNAQLLEQANIGALKRTCRVGSYESNLIGLHDMHGNVHEWCDDAVTGADGVSDWVHRGGGWFNGGQLSRAAYRITSSSDRFGNLGFRLARVRSVPVGAVSAADPKPDVPGTFTNTLGMKFVPVRKGTGWLGGVSGKQGGTKVEFKEDFYLGKYEVTQEEWAKVTGTNPSAFARTGKNKDAVKDVPDADLKRFPVEAVSWDDCLVFIKKLNEMTNESGWVYRLPKESEWEYGCRGGASGEAEGAFHFYLDRPTNALLPAQANFMPEPGKGLGRPCPVGMYPSSRLGLNDLHGNVWEWTDEPRTLDGTAYRLVMGGGWDAVADACRVTNRNLKIPTDRSAAVGLRLARVPAGKAP